MATWSKSRSRCSSSSEFCQLPIVHHCPSLCCCRQLSQGTLHISLAQLQPSSIGIPVYPHIPPFRIRIYQGNNQTRFLLPSTRPTLQNCRMWWFNRSSRIRKHMEHCVNMATSRFLHTYSCKLQCCPRLVFAFCS